MPVKASKQTVQRLVFVGGSILIQIYLFFFVKSKTFNQIIFQPFLILDSDDSDTEGGLGNVERVVMRPPGHSGKAKRGHLCFDSSFETGKRK